MQEGFSKQPQGASQSRVLIAAELQRRSWKMVLNDPPVITRCFSTAHADRTVLFLLLPTAVWGPG